MSGAVDVTDWREGKGAEIPVHENVLRSDEGDDCAARWDSEYRHIMIYRKCFAFIAIEEWESTCCASRALFIYI